jgi:hypothetical protein
VSENWKFQLSLKLENHLLNIRADSGAEFSEQLAWIEEHREPIILTIASLAPQRPQLPAAVSMPRPVPVAVPGASGREIGPVQIENVEMKKGPREGPPWKSPMYVVKWEGQSASTFDALNGKAAMGFWTNGNACFLTIEPSPKNPKYLNLTSIRMAA